MALPPHLLGGVYDELISFQATFYDFTLHAAGTVNTWFEAVGKTYGSLQFQSVDWVDEEPIRSVKGFRARRAYGYNTLGNHAAHTTGKEF